MGVAEDEFGVEERRLVGRYRGVVVSNNDPLKLGRVTVTVRGLMDEESDWALPSNTMGGGGASQDGFYAPPAVGSDVYVTFDEGHPDKPVYTSGNWGTGEAPSSLSPIPPEEAPQVPTLEYGPFAIQFDTRDGKQAWRVSVVGSETTDAAEYDMTTKTWRFAATGGFTFDTLGAMVFRAARMSFNDRPLANGTSKPV